MIINHNIQAINTHRNFGMANTQQAKSMEKLSSGLRINRAGDDAAGLAISEKMRAQVRGLDQASRNAQDGISLIQTAEGALTETHAILQRMRELAVQSANDTNTDTDRGHLQNEIGQLLEEIDRIATTTEFNTNPLLDTTGGATGSFTFHIGANQGQATTVAIGDMQVDALGLTDLKIGTQAEADAAITTVNTAIETVSSERAKLGAYQNRLEHTINNLNVASENLTASESRIRDVDMAKEMMNQTKQSILSQASQAMLAQAINTPQNVLQLLR